jgi:hypothetical protein
LDRYNFLLENVTKASLGVGLAFFAFGTSLTAYWVIRHGALSKDLIYVLIVFRPVFRIRDIFVWIRIRGSMPLTIMYPYFDPDPAIFVIDLQDASKKLIF